MSKSTLQAQPRIQSLILLARGRCMRELEYETHFPGPNFWGRNKRRQFLKNGTKLYQILGGHKSNGSFIGGRRICFKFQIACFVSELDRLKVQIWVKRRTLTTTL